MDPTGILTGLATELIKTGAGWLKEQAFGKPQQRALEQAATCAFRDLLSELQPQFPEKGAFDHLHSLLQMLVGDAPTAEALLAVALGKEAQPEGRLRACAEVAGIDTTSFPGDVTELLLRLAKLLSEEVYRRAEEPESPLYNLASLSSLTDMRRTLARLESRLDRFLAPYDHPAIDCRPAIEEFVTTYLGTPDEPVPFGGRDEALRLLDHWLFEQPDKPYALLAAPMGRGKSALLVRWHQRLLPRRDLQIVFFPVSIRFRLNAEDTVLRALTAALARLHGEKPEQLSRESAPVLRSMLADYLRRQQPPGGGRVLLILDGLDEAAGWDIGHGLLPGQPPAWLKVLISARTRPDDPDGRQWLEACGWTTDAGRPRNTVALFNLEVLDEPGVKQALKSMGFPLDRLGRKFLIVRELHRLCEGDVVLLRLYIDDLWQRGEEAARLKPEDLAQIKPGLEGYFERWWEDQKKLWGEDRAPEKIRQAQVLLCLLACAHGPLTPRGSAGAGKGRAGRCRTGKHLPGSAPLPGGGRPEPRLRLRPSAAERVFLPKICRKRSRRTEKVAGTFSGMGPADAGVPGSRDAAGAGDAALSVAVLHRASESAAGAGDGLRCAAEQRLAPGAGAGGGQLQRFSGGGGAGLAGGA